MKATIITQRKTSAVFPALEDSHGRKIAAPFTTHDEKLAMEYAEFSAKLNQHDDWRSVTWPKRSWSF